MNDPGMDHQAASDLLPALALDAVDADERHALEVHILGCPRCQTEIDGYRSVAAALGNQNMEVPPHLWDRIAAEVAASWQAESASELPVTLRSRLGDVQDRDVPRGRRLGAPRHERHASKSLSGGQRAGDENAAGDEKHVGLERPTEKRALSRRAGVLTAAAAAVVLAALGVELAHLEGQVNQQTAKNTGSVQGAALSALENPRHQTAVLRTATGEALAEAVTLEGHGYLVASAFSQLPATQTYQLWGLIDGGPVSLGLLGTHPHTLAFSYGTAHPSRIMVTIEPAAGVAVPDRTPIAQGDLA